MVEKIKDYLNYSVNDLGEVFNNKTGRKLKQTIKKGYCGVYLYNKEGRKFFLVHRLVATTFIPNPNNYPEVNHKDENPLNNNVNNLEWCTSKYNNNYGTHKEKLRKRMLENNPFQGKQHTNESKEKMSYAKKGKPSKRKRKIVIQGVEYDSVTQAMDILKISTRKLYQLLKENDENDRACESNAPR